MNSSLPAPEVEEGPQFMLWLGIYALLGCGIFAISILIADVVVPNHDWIADTISDLGAGRYEYIVDIGIYAFSLSLMAIALLCAHVHLGGWPWSLGIVALVILALVVFLIGARNEYGDRDQDGAVIHIYLVYAVGALVALVPFLMAPGASRVSHGYKHALRVIGAVWILAAPVFFFLPDDVDGLYERMLGLITFALVATFAHLFIKRARALPIVASAPEYTG